jgi:hypothetical protein
VCLRAHRTRARNGTGPSAQGALHDMALARAADAARSGRDLGLATDGLRACTLSRAPCSPAGTAAAALLAQGRSVEAPQGVRRGPNQANAMTVA